jgi:hypothetical protein
VCSESSSCTSGGNGAVPFRTPTRPRSSLEPEPAPDRAWQIHVRNQRRARTNLRRRKFEGGTGPDQLSTSLRPGSREPEQHYPNRNRFQRNSNLLGVTAVTPGTRWLSICLSHCWGPGRFFRIGPPSVDAPRPCAQMCRLFGPLWVISPRRSGVQWRGFEGVVSLPITMPTDRGLQLIVSEAQIQPDIT